MAKFLSTASTSALPGMSAGVAASGPFLFVSGQVALDGRGVVVGEGDFARQVEQVMANFRAVLDEAGATFKDVVRLGVFLSDRKHLAAWRELRANYFSDPFPASTLVIAELISPALLIEVEAVVALREPAP